MVGIIRIDNWGGGSIFVVFNKDNNFVLGFSYLIYKCKIKGVFVYIEKDL